MFDVDYFVKGFVCKLGLGQLRVSLRLRPEISFVQEHVDCTGLRLCFKIWDHGFKVSFVKIQVDVNLIENLLHIFPLDQSH